MEKRIKVQCILETGYNDKELGEFIEKDKIYYVTEERAKLLEEKNAVKRIKELSEKDHIEKKEETERPKRRTRQIM